MTITVVIMIIIGIIICLASFFVSEKFSNRGEQLHSNLMSVDEDYEFSERELRIIRRKIEDVIANQAKDILYETNESLSNMANEKTMALGDYAVAVCEQIEKNHKEVMFLYSMLDDKQKDIMKTVRIVNDANKEAKDVLALVRKEEPERISQSNISQKQSALEQLAALSQKKKETDAANLLSAEVREEKNFVEKPDVVEEELVTALEEEIPVEDTPAQEEYLDYQENIEADLDSDTEDMADVFAELDETDIDFDEVLEEEFVENENSNDIILQMHRNGNSILDIAKQLGLGVGEVKLVIDLYQGE